MVEVVGGEDGLEMVGVVGDDGMIMNKVAGGENGTEVGEVIGGLDGMGVVEVLGGRRAVCPPDCTRVGFIYAVSPQMRLSTSLCALHPVQSDAQLHRTSLLLAVWNQASP